MSKTITRITDIGLETINEGAKRFHVFGICKLNKGMPGMIERCDTYVKKMQKRGFSLVPFEDVFDYGDWCEMYDKEGNLVRFGVMLPEDGRNIINHYERE